MALCRYVSCTCQNAASAIDFAIITAMQEELDAALKRLPMHRKLRRMGTVSSRSSKPKGKIRLYIVESHSIIREGFARALAGEPDMSVVGQAETAAQALMETVKIKPDVVTTNLLRHDLDGIELLRALHAQLPAAKLVVISAYDDEFHVAEALRAGAQGYLCKYSRLEEVIDGIRRIAAGGEFVLVMPHTSSRGHGRE